MTQICLAVLDQAKFQNTVEGVHSVQVGWVLVETSELFVVFSKCPKNRYGKLYNLLKPEHEFFTIMVFEKTKYSNFSQLEDAMTTQK